MAGKAVCKTLGTREANKCYRKKAFSFWLADQSWLRVSFSYGLF